MDLSLRTETFAQEDQTWLASAHGTSNARSVTLDRDAIDNAVDSGMVKSGTPLGRISASGKFGLYDPEADDGTEVLWGFLFTTVAVKDGDVVAAMLDHGKVFAERCPDFTYTDAAARDTVGRIIFVDKAPVAVGAPSDDGGTEGGN